MNNVIPFRPRTPGVSNPCSQRRGLDPDRARAENNAAVLRMWGAGMSLAAVPASATMFPPRPIIAKSSEDIRRLYGG